MNIISSIAFVCVVAGSLGAQSVSPAVSVGAKLRIRTKATGTHEMLSTVVAMSPDTLTLRSDSNIVRLPMTALDRVEMLMPRTQTAGIMHGVKVGMLLGAVAGAVFAGLSEGSCTARSECGLGVFAIPTLAFLGMPIGAIVGASAPGSHWQRMNLPLTPPPRSMKLGLSLRGR
jgi:hypothetical protein